MTATCPPGKQLLGGSGAIVGGSGQVYLDGIKPDAALTSVTVEAVEDGDGFTGSWRLRAFAICADPVAGLQRVVAQSFNSDSSRTEQVIATCPVGTRLVSACADILNGSTVVAQVEVQATESAPVNGSNWAVRTHAICATA